MKEKIQACVPGLLLCLAAGCYSSAPLHHDGTTDPAPDPVVDPVYDPYPDPYNDPHVDPVVDPYYDPPYDPYYDPWTDPDVPPVCPMDSGIWFDIEVSGAPTTGPEGMERECIVEWNISEPEWTEIGLGCPVDDDLMAMYVISIYTAPEVYEYLPEGISVLFSYVIDDPWWRNRWFSIRYLDGPLFLAAVDATDLAPYGMDPYAWYSPLGVSLVTGYCPWTWGDCGDEERAALGVSFEGMNDFAFDGNEIWIGMWGMYHVIVDTAVVYHNIRCEDFYNSWIRALFVSMPVR